jgi:hypothetical protein
VHSLNDGDDNDIQQDYLDAFEKLMKLNLKSSQEREILYVLIHCCLQVIILMKILKYDLNIGKIIQRILCTLGNKTMR